MLIKEVEALWDVKYSRTYVNWFENDEYVTTNGMYVHTRHGSRRSDGAIKVQKQILEQIDTLPDKIASSVWCYTLSLKFVYDRSNWITKGGDLKQLDVSNLVKVIEDGLMRAFGVDDKKCVGISSDKSFTLDPRISIPPYIILYRIDTFTK